MKVDELLAEALAETKHLQEGEVFLVKDLFKGYVWHRLPIKERLLLGTLFLHEVNKAPCGVLPVEKTSSHQQRYKKC